MMNLTPEDRRELCETMNNDFGRSLTVAAERLVEGVPELIGAKDYQLLFVGIARMVLLVTLVWMWRRFRRV